MSTRINQAVNDDAHCAEPVEIQAPPQVQLFGCDAESREKRWSAKGRAAGLTGWQQIVAFPGHPGAVVQRWASEGTVHVATEDTDFAAELKRGLALPRREKEPNAAKKQIAHPKKARRR